MNAKLASGPHVCGKARNAVRANSTAAMDVVIALVFIGAWKDPVRNRWLYQFAMLAGALVVPWALVFGAFRGIPVWWRCIDSLFGIGAILPAWFCHRWACSLEQNR